MIQASSPPLEYPVEYMVTELDALGYVNQCWVISIILWVTYALVLQDILPLIVLILVVILGLPRWIISVHELLHIYSPQQVNRIMGLLGTSPVPLSILTLGYSELQTIHFDHHRAPATDDDPDIYRIRGSSGWAFFNSLTNPEQAAIRWISAHGLSLSLAIELVIKLLLLGSLAWLGSTTFLWFWLALRFTYGVSDFSFFRCVHHQQGKEGTFALSLPPRLIPIGEWVFGQTVMQATLNHDLHHQNPGLAARSLAQARRQNKLARTIMQQLSTSNYCNHDKTT